MNKAKRMNLSSKLSNLFGNKLTFSVNLPVELLKVSNLRKSLPLNFVTNCDVIKSKVLFELSVADSVGLIIKMFGMSIF